MRQLSLNMIKRVSLFLVFAIVLCFLQLSAKQVPLSLDTVSVSLATLSPPTTAATITPSTLMLPDSLTKALIAEEFKKGFGYEVFNFEQIVKAYLLTSNAKTSFQKGTPLFRGKMWIISCVFIFVLIFVILKNNFPKQLTNLVDSFFNNRVFANLTKEENLFFSWFFIFLFVLFGFLFGLFIYLAIAFQSTNKVYNFQFFLSISGLVMLLFLAKVIVLYLLGVIFNIKKLVAEYISILYLSYFNAGLLFLPLVIFFCLSTATNSNFYILAALVSLTAIFGFQFIKRGINVFANYQFSKVYLILYFCALEICPILILIKLIGLRAN